MSHESREERSNKETLEKLALLEQKIREFEKLAINAKRDPKRTTAEEAAYRQEREQVIEEIVQNFRRLELNDNQGFNQWIDAMLNLLTLFSAFAKAIYVRPPLPPELRQLLFSTRHENPLSFTELVQHVGAGIGSIPESIKSLTDQIGKPRDPSPRTVQYAVEFANNGRESLGRVALFSDNGPLRAFIKSHQAELKPGLLSQLMKRKSTYDALPEIETAFLACLIEWVNTQNLGNGQEYELSLEARQKNPHDPDDVMDDVFLRMELKNPAEGLSHEDKLKLILGHQQKLVDALNTQTAEQGFDHFLAQKIKHTNIALNFEAKEPMELPPRARM